MDLSSWSYASGGFFHVASRARTYSYMFSEYVLFLLDTSLKHLGVGVIDGKGKVCHFVGVMMFFSAFLMCVSKK